MSALLAGALVFTLDILLLALLFRWLWQKQKSLTKLKMLLLLLTSKILLLAAGTLLAMYLWQEDIWLYVLGALIALLVLLLLFTCVYKYLYSDAVVRERE